MLKFASSYLSIAAVLGGTALAGAQDIPVTDYVKDSGKLTIANTIAYAPFEYMDEAGKPVGLSIETAQAAADKLGVELQIDQVPFANLIPSIASGRTKIAWATASVTAERLAQVDFVAHMITGTSVATLPENAEKFADRMGLCGHTVAVQTGTSADFAADKLMTECTEAGNEPITKSIYPSQQDTVQAVITGRADAYLDDTTSAGYYSKTSNGRLVLTGESFNQTPLGHIIAKGDTATAEMLAGVIQALMDDGTYHEILEKYGMTFAELDAPVIYTDASQLSAE